MDDQLLLDHIHDLTDLELAILLSLVANEHCLIETDDQTQDDLAAELGLIVSDVFKLSYIILERDDLRYVDKFGEAILDEDAEFGDVSNASTSDFESSSNIHSKITAISFNKPTGSSTLSHQKLDNRKVVNVIIAKDFNFAHEDVQIQMLELIRRKRLFTRTTVHLAPTTFLFLPLVTTSARHIRLTRHLNDRIFMSHRHERHDGFLHLEELDNHSEDDISTYSLELSSSARRQQILSSRRIDSQMIQHLRLQGQQATVTPEIRRYLQDIVVFLRIERGVDGGISPFATTLLLSLAKYLAPFHGIDYVTPSLVALAAKKIYPHRIVIATPKRERSIQYGTSLATAQDILADIDPHSVIQNVLDTVQCPT